MITETKLSVEPKGYDLMEVPNRLHVIMLAEPGWVVPAGRYERRYAAFNVSDKRRGDHAYFKALHGEIKNGGAAAMMYDLQRMDLGDWHPREVYRTSALTEQTRHSLSAIEEWYEQLLQDAVLPHALTGRPETVISAHLYEDARKRFPYLRTHLSDTKFGFWGTKFVRTIPRGLPGVGYFRRSPRPAVTGRRPIRTGLGLRSASGARVDDTYDGFDE